MKAKKINFDELKIKSFVTTLNNDKDLKTNMLKGGTSFDETDYTKDIQGDCIHLIKL